MKNPKIKHLLLLLLIVLVSVSGWILSHRSKPSQPVPDFPRLASGVTLRDVTFHSQALQRDMQYRVFLPEKHGAERLPVVYLLHGGGGTFRDWSNYSNVAQFAARGFVLVMPEGDYSYYTNAVHRPQERYEDYIVNDLTADVETRFPARTDRDGRAIVGVSMGGFGAVKLALNHPEKFAFSGAMSPAIDVPRRAFSWRRLDQSRRFRELFGEQGSEARRNGDPFFLAASIDPARSPYFYLTCGRQESLLRPNREFAALLERRKIAYEFRQIPGGHDWNQWNGNLATLFEGLEKHVHKH